MKMEGKMKKNNYFRIGLSLWGELDSVVSINCNKIKMKCPAKLSCFVFLNVFFQSVFPVSCEECYHRNGIFWKRLK